MPRGIPYLCPGQCRVFLERFSGPISSTVLSGNMTNEHVIYFATIRALLRDLRTALINAHTPISIMLNKWKHTFQSNIQIYHLKSIFYMRNINNIDKSSYKDNCFSFSPAENRLLLQGHSGMSCAVSNVCCVVTESYIGTTQSSPQQNL